MTLEQANAIRLRFYSTVGWVDVARVEHKLVAALKALPNEGPMRHVNVFYREMYEDAKREVEGK